MARTLYLASVEGFCATADMPEGEERDRALLALNEKRMRLSMMMERR